MPYAYDGSPRFAGPVVVGLTLAVLINSLVQLSGANLNPTASMGFFVLGDLPRQMFFPYIGFQILGSTLGAAFVRALMPPEKVYSRIWWMILMC
jgi:glycerol uptake facilitator-like aquaporin